MSIIPPGTGRIIGDRDAPEAYIPLAPGRSSVFQAIRQRMKDGPTEEERVRIKEEMARDEATRLAQMQALRDRHVRLMQVADSPVVVTLLEQHAPRDVEGRDGNTYQECHGCPMYHDSDEGDEAYHEWPCPTWQTISAESPVR